MVYQGILKLNIDKRNQDPYQEPKEANFGPFDSTNGVETALLAVYKGDMNNFSVIGFDNKAKAYVLGIYVSNELELPADPLASKHTFLIEKLNIAAGGTANGKYYCGNWKWLILTEQSVGGETDHIYIDIHANQRAAG